MNIVCSGQGAPQLHIPFDDDASDAVFSTLDINGRFSPEAEKYLLEIGRTRPSMVLAFPPKSAGTFIRTAAIVAIQGQLGRTVHAQGGRDAQFYLPSLLLYYSGGVPAKPLVTHVHMQALPANQRIIEALSLHPIVMLRSLPDMLASYLAMLDEESQSPDRWLNVQVPPNYAELSADTKADFIIEMVGPWYASYFSTWLEYAAHHPHVQILQFEHFLADPAAVLGRLLVHSRFNVSKKACSDAIEEVWIERHENRFREGVSGNGRKRFSAAQLARIERLLSFYPVLQQWKEILIS